jgi:hypothetical protein
MCAIEHHSLRVEEVPRYSVQAAGRGYDGEAVDNRPWQGRIELESQPLAGKGHPQGSTRQFGARLDSDGSGRGCIGWREAAVIGHVRQPAESDKYPAPPPL